MYAGNSEKSTKELLDLIHEYNKVNIENQLYLPILAIAFENYIIYNNI